MSEYLSVSCILILSSCLLLIPALLPAAAAAVLCETIIMKHVPAECLHGLKVLSKSYKYVGGKRLPYCCCCWHRRLGRRLPTTYWSLPTSCFFLGGNSGEACPMSRRSSKLRTKSALSWGDEAKQALIALSLSGSGPSASPWRWHRLLLWVGRSLFGVMHRSTGKVGVASTPISSSLLIGSIEAKCFIRSRASYVHGAFLANL